MRSTTKSRARHIPQKPALSFCTWSLKGRSLPSVGTGGRQLVQHATSIGDGAHAFPSQTAHPNRVCCRARSTNINVEAGNRPSGAAKPTPQKSAIDTAKLHFTDHIGDWSPNGKHQIAMVIREAETPFFKSAPVTSDHRQQGGPKRRCARRSVHTGCFNAAASIGILRKRLPVAAKIALATAGTIAEVPGSPIPPGSSELGRYAPRSRALR
jgi:hypothetical protein